MTTSHAIPPLVEALLKLETLADGGKEDEALAPTLWLLEQALRDGGGVVVRQQIGMEGAQVAVADEPSDGASGDGILEGEFHPVGAKRRGGEAEGPLVVHLLVEEDAGLGSLVVRLVEDDEVGSGRIFLEERDGVDVLAVEVLVDLHDLLEQMVARGYPVHAEPPAEAFLEALDDLKRHECLAGTHGGFEHHGLEARLVETLQAGIDRVLLILAELVFH